jgi:hypothetical protein
MFRVEVRNLKSLVNQQVGGESLSHSFELWAEHEKGDTLMCVCQKFTSSSRCGRTYITESKLQGLMGHDKWGDTLRKITESKVREHYLTIMPDGIWDLASDPPRDMGFWTAFDLWVEHLEAEHEEEVC